MKRNIIFLLLLPAVFGFAQNWQGVNTNHFNYEIRTIYQRPADGKLYIGGTFLKNGDTTLNAIAYYENGSWLTLGNGVATTPYCPYPVSQIIEYHGDLYVTGGGGGMRHGIVKWNGSSFDTLGNGVDGSVVNLFEHEDKLFVLGNFANAGGLSCSGIAMWDGANWSILGADIQPDFPPAHISCGTFYNNELYVGGNFTAPGGYNEIAKWDGQSWLPVGNGFVGGLASLGNLVVYNGELYASGTFSYDNGANPGNYIARWDGTQWHDVGGGVIGLNGSNGQINELQIFNNELYAGGVFSYAGGVDAEFIAKWNGQEWCSLGSDFDNIIFSMGVHNNELYISGGFWTIDGDSILKVAKWIGGDYTDTCGVITEVEEIDKDNALKIYPNPATNILTIETTQPDKASYTIYNLTGSLLQTSSLIQKKEIDVSGFAEGVYVIQLQTEFGEVRKKFVKQ